MPRIVEIVLYAVIISAAFNILCWLITFAFRALTRRLLKRR